MPLTCQHCNERMYALPWLSLKSKGACAGNTSGDAICAGAIWPG